MSSIPPSGKKPYEAPIPPPPPPKKPAPLIPIHPPVYDPTEAVISWGDIKNLADDEKKKKTDAS